MLKPFLLLPLLVVITSQLSTAADMVVKPDNDLLRYVGRFTNDYRFSWTGSMIEVEFTGSSVSASFSSANTKKPVAMTAILDGKEQVIFVKPGQNNYPIAKGLGQGKHHLVLFRRSEASFGVLKFNGLTFPKGTRIFKPTAPKRKIHVIGDSITCGYGNEATSLKEGNTVENENGYMSYAAITARHLEADVVMTSWSGKGMYRNGTDKNDPETTIPKLFDYILPQYKKEIYKHTDYIPDVFVINLGTNDLRKQNRADLEKAPYVKTYRAFIARLRKYAPEAHIILAIGPMQTKPVDSWLTEIAKSDTKAHALVFSGYKSADEKAGHYHPSVKKDHLMAAQLSSKIRSVTRWK